MGCLSFWRFVAAKKRYAPVYRNPAIQRNALGGPDNKFRIDMQGSFYSAIRYSYSSSCNVEVAHATFLKNLESRVKDKAAAVLYFDGAQCEEKLETQQKRQLAREKMVDAADQHVNTFIQLVTSRADNAGIRKRHFANVQKQLKNAYRWNSTARDGLVRFLEARGWDVVQCETEADVAIARDTVEGDIVISGDSDLFIYQSVSVLWRPQSKAGYLEYQKTGVLSALGLESAAQLTALGVVSTNDYNHSVHGLGCETNYKIIKSIEVRGSDGHSMSS